MEPVIGFIRVCLREYDVFEKDICNIVFLFTLFGWLIAAHTVTFELE